MGLATYGREMTSSDTLYVFLFVAVFPALWILARVLDRVVPDNSEHHSPRQERERKQKPEAPERGGERAAHARDPTEFSTQAIQPRWRISIPNIS